MMSKSELPLLAEELSTRRGQITVRVASRLSNVHQLFGSQRRRARLADPGGYRL
jgi:hypothetical protein